LKWHFLHQNVMFAVIEESRPNHQCAAASECPGAAGEVRLVCECPAGWHPKCQARAIERSARCPVCRADLTEIDRKRLWRDFSCCARVSAGLLSVAVGLFVIAGIDYSANVEYGWGFACVLYPACILLAIVKWTKDFGEVFEFSFVPIFGLTWVTFTVLTQGIGIGLMYAFYRVLTWNVATAGLGLLAVTILVLSAGAIAVVVNAIRSYVASLYLAKVGPVATSV